jgi:hypothetical protein
MARPSRVNDPVAVQVGSVWAPRWPGLKVPLEVMACVDRPNGTNFVVKSLEPGQINRTRLVSYKYLLGKYEQLEQAPVHQ